MRSTDLSQPWISTYFLYSRSVKSSSASGPLTQPLVGPTVDGEGSRSEPRTATQSIGTCHQTRTEPLAESAANAICLTIAASDRIDEVTSSEAHRAESTLATASSRTA